MSQKAKPIVRKQPTRKRIEVHSGHQKLVVRDVKTRRLFVRGQLLDEEFA